MSRSSALPAAILAFAVGLTVSRGVQASVWDDLGDGGRAVGRAFIALGKKASGRGPAGAEGPAGARDERLALLAGLRCPCTARRDRLGGPSHATTRLELRGRNGNAVLVVKEFSSLTRIEWKLSPIQGRPVPPVTDPREQVLNAVRMAREFQAAGLRTAEIVAADPDAPWIATRFLRAEPLASVIERSFALDPRALATARRLGGALAAAHRRGLVVGDLTVENVLVDGGEPVFFDLDQAAFSTRSSWDLTFFLFDALTHVPAPRGEFARSRGWLRFAESLLQGYRDGGGALDPDAMFSTHSLAAALTTFVARPDRLPVVLEHLRRAVGRSAP